MFSPSLAVYQYVVEEYKKVLPQLSSENVIHTRLECGWCIGQPERHDQELKVPKMASDAVFSMSFSLMLIG
jgi:hypothetical protein